MNRSTSKRGSDFKRSNSNSNFRRNKSRNFSRDGNKGFSEKGGGRFNKSRRGRFNRNRNQKNFLDHSRYIAKAEKVEDTVYHPENSFKDFALEPQLAKNIASKGYENPREIQDLAMPSALEGRDIIGLAATGSGKTAAFLIPLLNKAIKDRKQKVLIIAPTRELAQQIREECFEFSTNTRIRSMLAIGGENIFRQIQILNKNPQVVIGTPGRVLDLAERNKLDLSSFNNVVLDEVDRMLDMGFVDDIKSIIHELPEERQSLFFSATMNKEARQIADELLNGPKFIQATQGRNSMYVEQDIVKVPRGEDKMEKLHEILIKEEVEKVLVFSSTKRYADKLSRELHQRGFKVDSIHGDKTQNRRKRVISKFKENQIKILVATDVVARGIDVPDITHVINFDEPSNFDDYTHRIGRTGRNGKKGVALTFVN